MIIEQNIWRIKLIIMSIRLTRLICKSIFMSEFCKIYKIVERAMIQYCLEVSILL